MHKPWAHVWGLPGLVVLFTLPLLCTMQYNVLLKNMYNEFKVKANLVYTCPQWFSQTVFQITYFCFLLVAHTAAALIKYIVLHAVCIQLEHTTSSWKCTLEVWLWCSNIHCSCIQTESDKRNKHHKITYKVNDKDAIRWDVAFRQHESHNTRNT